VDDVVDKPPADPSDDEVEDDSRTGTRKDAAKEVEGANGTACKQDLHKGYTGYQRNFGHFNVIFYVTSHFVHFSPILDT
jgi:hypothetical protein